MRQGNKTAAAGGKTEFAGREKRMFHLMLLPGMIMLFLFVFVPLFGMLEEEYAIINSSDGR